MRIFLIALALVYVFGVSYARSVFIGPDKCPTSANAPVYIAEEEIEAPDLNGWRDIAADAAPVIDLDIAEAPQTNRVFARFPADPQTGDVFGDRNPACRD